MLRLQGARRAAHWRARLSDATVLLTSLDSIRRKWGDYLRCRGFCRKSFLSRVLLAVDLGNADDTLRPGG